MNATKEAWNGLDQKYKISDNTAELASKTKSAFMGLFSKWEMNTFKLSNSLGYFLVLISDVTLFH